MCGILEGHDVDSISQFGCYFVSSNPNPEPFCVFSWPLGASMGSATIRAYWAYQGLFDHFVGCLTSGQALAAKTLKGASGDLQSLSVLQVQHVCV